MRFTSAYKEEGLILNEVKDLRSPQTRPNSFPRWTTPALFTLLFAAVTLTHLTLLRLPYFWDEGGYYIPAALDFYNRHTLIPHFTNAHPPLPSILLGTLWHLTGGPGILTTRIAICSVAAVALTAVFRLAHSLLDARAAVTLTALTAAYPIWFVQSSLAHADIFAAAFTLAAFALYLPATSSPEICHLEHRGEPAVPHYLLIAFLFSLAALSKETAIVQPATLAALHLYRLAAQPAQRRENLRWLAALSFPIVPLAVWFAYHRYRTGFTFGNPEYLRYNATANFTLPHIAQALYYRAIHLFWQRNIWLPILLALACLLLPRRQAEPETSNSTLTPHQSTAFTPAPPATHSRVPHPYALFADGWIHRERTLSPALLRTLTLLIAVNWLAFSILGGALLTRYLLPIYPLILLLCLDTWRARTPHWPALAALTAAAFISALWVNPPTSFAPEDNLTYRDMIVVHQNAIHYIADHYPGATVLTAWPVTTDLFNPWLGYSITPIKAVPLENFTLPEVQKAAADTAATGSAPYDTALVFTTRYISPELANYYRTRPTTRRARDYQATRDLTPREVATLLHGTIVFQQQIGGEWAAVIRFPRTYSASG